MKEHVRILLVDDHFLIREGIKNILAQNEFLDVVGEAVDGQSALKSIEKLRPDITLLDINLPDFDGFEVLTRIKDRGLPGKILILSAYEETEYLMRAKKLGADGYVLKTFTSKSLLDGICSIMDGYHYFQEAAEVIDKHFAGNEEHMILKEKMESLTKREYEILSLMGKGMNNNEIAESLFISEKTVKNHISSIFKKLDVEDRVQAVILFFQIYANSK